jgi:hypothetical protein
VTFEGSPARDNDRLAYACQPAPMSFRWLFLQFVAIRWAGRGRPFILFAITPTHTKQKQ